MSKELRHLVSDAPRVMVVDGSKLVRKLIGDVLAKELPGVEVVACALGTPTWVVEACHAKGAKVMSIVGLAKHARSAIRNGTDVVIVQGTEGGGHTGDVGLITLPPGSRIGGRIAIAVYVADGAGIRAMERTVAQLGAAAFEFFSGQSAQPPPVPRKRAPRRRS